MTRRLALLPPFAIAAVLAGCGSSTSSGASSSNAASAAAPQASSGGTNSLTLRETEFKITPVAPTVSKTGTITITVNNTGTIEHALAVQTPSGLVKTAPISPGSSATLKVDATKDGRYVFYCPIDHHRAAGMQGVLVVGSAASSATSAPASTTTSSKPAGGYAY